MLILVQNIKAEQNNIRKEVDELKEVVTGIAEVKGPFEVKIRDVIREEISEAKETEKRCLNVMIKGVVEIEDDPQATSSVGHLPRVQYQTSGTPTESAATRSVGRLPRVQLSDQWDACR